MSGIHFLPPTPTVRVTPELLCRLVENGKTDRLGPYYEEGDITLTVQTEELAKVMRAFGLEVVVGYQNWGSNAPQLDLPEGEQPT